MSQYQPNAAPGKSFISKINSKFSTMAISSHTEKDGSTEDDTLIHNAFVKFFDEQGQGYPEWLGTKNQNGAQPYRGSYQEQSKYQPVRASYNSTPSASTNYSNNSANYTATNPATASQTGPRPTSGGYSSSDERPAYTRKSSSKLQDMYQRSRASAGSQGSPSAPGRSQSSGSTPRSTAAGQRLREKMMNGSSARPTWGRGNE
ncbi:uncharacterized protein CXQ87_004750 [Candidozyma duobushaemuli]|uniref:Mso1 N-terminal domain-containing protein n=2 Tax=Candidozyma TaxID=3303203 RepID=A0ABX8IAC8_9ASCO|nr:uncharacterized protein CXQ87_004750 [[Candida] duobushaemulonis]PVH16459.1 hypothetical protein CXQ87_004750 [[Candida] duobushaemulonis]QWU90226.1 hypothetical protein CA3LBN_004587 [[Candida] haemuloni]